MKTVKGTGKVARGEGVMVAVSYNIDAIEPARGGRQWLMTGWIEYAAKMPLEPEADSCILHLENDRKLPISLISFKGTDGCWYSNIQPNSPNWYNILFDV